MFFEINNFNLSKTLVLCILVAPPDKNQSSCESRIFRATNWSMLAFFICLCLLSAALAFQAVPANRFASRGRTSLNDASNGRTRRLRKGESDLGTQSVPGASTFVVGEDLPEEIESYKAIYDMILVERYSRPEKTITGLYIPSVSTAEFFATNDSRFCNRASAKAATPQSLAISPSSLLVSSALRWSMVY